MKKLNWRKYGFEFLSIFIAVTAAFALNNWNENRKNELIESKILAEIANGLKKDIKDVQLNKKGHKFSITASQFLGKIIREKQVSLDTLIPYYFEFTRDYIAIQNISGYESLKSKGLELITNDSLRFEIINLYEYDYTVLKKFEEEYQEMQYYKNYFKEINSKIAPNFIFDNNSNLVSIRLPLEISAAEKNILLSYLWKIQTNRNFVLREYDKTEEKIIKLRAKIERYLDQK